LFKADVWRHIFCFAQLLYDETDYSPPFTKAPSN